MARRLCRQCKSPLGVDDDRCQVCGALNPVVHPWYIWPIGFAMLALIAWALIDFEWLERFIDRFGEPR